MSINMDENSDSKEMLVVPLETKRYRRRRAMAVVDTRNKIVPPVDFSFCDLAYFSDALREVPRQGGPKPNSESKATPSKAFRVNNNNLSDYKGMMDILNLYFVDVSAIAWLDMSFNTLPKIGKELLQLPNLQILYLHGNVITKTREINKLRALTCLNHITLHCNPIDREKYYRYNVLTILPQLARLDFTDVSPSERFVCSQIIESNIRKKKKPKY